MNRERFVEKVWELFERVARDVVRAPYGWGVYIYVDHSGDVAVSTILQPTSWPADMANYISYLPAPHPDEICEEGTMDIDPFLEEDYILWLREKLADDLEYFLSEFPIPA